MLEWHDFVEQLLSEESSFDGISLSFDGTAHSVGVPPIIKASVLILDKMITHQGKFNILVFPERIQSIFIFTLIKLLHNIAEGKIERAYDPEAFKPGEKLKLGNAVVEFVGIEDEKNERRMKIKVADLTISAPIEYFPLFQLTNTQRRLSPYEKYVVEKKKIEGLISHLTADEKFLKMLADYRTHMDSSIVSMTSVINAKELLSTCKLCGRDIKSILLVGQADYEGNVKNVGAGQLGGVPAVVLVSDLYAIAALAGQGHPIQSIIIDGSNANILLSQMDALDNLMRLGVPITCVTDIVNSFDLQPFLDRQFNVWRWDETSITDHLYDVNPLSSDRKIKHCAKREVKYLVSDGNEISIAIRKLYFHRGETQTLSVQMLKLFDKLFSLAFVALHETVPFNDDQLIRPKLILDECSSILAGEKNYLASKTYDDYSTIISCLKKVFIKGYPLPKHDALATRLRSEKYKSICIIVPERSDKKHVQEYWQMWCRRQRLITQVYVLYPAEYYPALTTQFSATVVVGWLKRAIMRKILYGFNTQTYTILLYDYEKRWKNYDTQKWNSALDSLQNRKTIERSFATDKLHVSTSRFVPPEPVPADTPKADEFAEIEVVLRENKYRQYVANGGQKAANETAEAIPVNYVGGYLAFYRTGHKVISATNIIMNDADKIDAVLPEQLKMGDFVVVRETAKDLIREMADVILARSGKSGLREMAGKWKEALKIETLFYSDDEIYQHLQGAGCTKGYQAVRGWIHDDDVIAPQSRQDLEHIASATGSGVLKELLDQIYDAAQTVRSAHIQAGKVLSMHATTAIRLFASLLYGAKAMRVDSEKDRDPYWTNMGYYNSIRELGQAATWIRADIDQHLDVMYKRRFEDKRYPTKEEYRKNRRYIWRDEELTSRISGSEVTASLANLGIRYPGEVDSEGKIKEHPIDICLATNMISVGLDVSRLGLMTVAGQPKTTSEYIQATSRVGRDAENAPGLVFVLYRPGRPRDKSHYEQFRSYHSRVYCNVEPTSVTPFSAPVRERALHAIMVGMMRLESDDRFNEDPPRFPDDGLIDKVRSVIENRVDDIDSEELDATLDRMEYILQCWEDWNPRKWEPAKNPDWSYADPVPLMYSSGSHPNEAWGSRGIETPTSMRSVDASCEAEVLTNRYVPKEG